MDAELKTLMGMLLECQARKERSINELAAQVGRSHEPLEDAVFRLKAAHRRTEEAIRDLAAKIRR